MNHSDEVSGAVVGISSQVAQKGIETAQHLVDKTIDNIAKLLQCLSNVQLGKSKDKDVKSSDMTDIKPGEVDIKELVADAKNNGDSVVSTDGYSKSDIKFIEKKAKEYGIPVAFTSKKNADNIAAHVRECDKGMFERICTENMQGKLKERPQELENFKAQRWEIDGIQRELSTHDLNANWGKTKDGEYFCLYEKADKKAVLMARSEFVRKCDEVEKGLAITKGDDEFYTLTDTKTGGEITFDTVPSKSELSALLQDKFGYDENKAEIACGKFGESLEGDLRSKFFENNPQNEFSKIENHVELKGENILAKDYDCLRLTPKSDGVPCIVFRDNGGNFAVLNPDKMSRKQMTEIVSESLGLTEKSDKKTVAALVEKAEKVGDFYARQGTQNFTHSRTFSAKDFDLDNPTIVANLERSDGMGNVYVKAIPVTEISTEIERVDKSKFTVKSVALSIEKCKGEDFPKTAEKSLVLSLSDKKNALAQLHEMYENQGVSPDRAKQMAREVFAKAQSQSPEKVLQIEEIHIDKSAEKLHSTATVRVGNLVEEIELNERGKAIADLIEKFGVCEEEAEILLDQAGDRISDEFSDNMPIQTDEKPLDVSPKTAAPITPKADVDVPEVEFEAPAPKRK